jgi:nicotinamidase/pyrazinamidase
MKDDRSTIDRNRTALLLVDLQADFMPGGALAVAQGDEIIDPLCSLIARNRFWLYAATQDWHPEGHVSFASSHPGRNAFDRIDLYGRPQTLWPDHCIQGSPGAALDPGIPWDSAAVIVRKGMDPAVDSYSGFRNNWDRDGTRAPTGLAGYLRERGITTVYLCGLARDVCVKWTAEDAVAAGLETALVWDLTRPVDPASDAAVRSDLERVGVRIVLSDEI